MENPQHIEQQLITLVEQREAMQARINDAPDRMRPAYEIALGGIRASISATLEAEETQTYAQFLQDQYEKDYQEIEELHQQNLISEEAALQLLEGIIKHEDYRFLRLFRALGGTILSPAAADVVVEQVPADTAPEPVVPVPVATLPVAEPEAPAPDAPAPLASTESTEIIRNKATKVTFTFTDAQISVQHDDVVAGDAPEQQIFFKSLSKRLYNDRCDLATVLSMLEKHTEYTFADIWEHLRPSEEFDKVTFGQLRTWMDVINIGPNAATLGDILVHNGKRGIASRYTLNPLVDINIVDERAAKPATKVQTAPATPVAPVPVAKPAVPAAPVRAQAPRPATPTPKPAPAPAPEAPKAPEARKPKKWEADFKRSIGDAIDFLEKSGLMTEEKIVARIANMRAQSTKLANLTAIRAINGSGIIKIASERDDPMDSELSAAELILMRVFAKHKQVISQRTNHAVVLELIEQAATSYFTKQKAKK